jgi:uncharacterized C2H2 Zn-finger protein
MVVSYSVLGARKDITMPADVMKLFQSVLAEKTAVATKERELINNLNRVLPGMGYRVVPLALRERTSHGPRPRTLAARPGGKPLSCPRCSRTFAHPLHLGRHMSATHGAKQSTAKAKAKAAKKSS